MARTEHSPETKAAVMAALLTGQSIAETARAYAVPEATVRSWKSRQRHGESVATVATEKRAAIGELLVDYLSESITTLREQVRLFRDPAWLMKQPASEAAVLHGVIADKAVRLLEALRPPEPGDEADDVE